MDKLEAKKAILVIVIGLIVLELFYDKDILLYIAVSVGTLSLLSNKISLLISRIWFGLAKLLGKINGTILLSMIFFLVLTPIALFLRLFGKNLLQLSPPKTTTFIQRNHTYMPEDLDNSW